MGAHGSRTRRRTGPAVSPALAGALALVVSSVLAGCADGEPTGPDAGPAPTTDSTTTAPPTSPATPGTSGTPSPPGTSDGVSTGSTAGGVPRLRFDDNGSRLTLQVDRTAVILLPAESWSWTDPVVDGTAVTISEDISDAESTSRSWTVTAREPGTATISTTGSPTCRSATPPCASPDLRWEVRVTVG